MSFPLLAIRLSGGGYFGPYLFSQHKSANSNGQKGCPPQRRIPEGMLNGKGQLSLRQGVAVETISPPSGPMEIQIAFLEKRGGGRGLQNNIQVFETGPIPGRGQIIVKGISGLRSAIGKEAVSLHKGGSFGQNFQPGDFGGISASNSSIRTGYGP